MSETKPGSAPEIKESKEKEPKITVDFFFSLHGTEEDFSRLPEALKNADVFVPELAGWTEQDKAGFNLVSRGIIDLANKPAEAFEGVPPAIKSELLLLNHRKIPVIFADLPAEHSLVEKHTEAIKKIRGSWEDFVFGNFDEAMKNSRQGMEDLARLTKEREDFIAVQLKKELPTLTEKFPELKNKKNIRVLMALGAAHTSLYHNLKPELVESKMILGRGTIVFNTEHEITRRLVRNPQENISDDLYARYLLEHSILSIMADISKDSTKCMWASRKLAAKLSMDKIQNFSEIMGSALNKGTGEVKQEELFGLIRKNLGEMGIKLPTTEEEIDKLINIRKK